MFSFGVTRLNRVTALSILAYWSRFSQEGTSLQIMYVSRQDLVSPKDRRDLSSALTFPFAGQTRGSNPFLLGPESRGDVGWQVTGREAYKTGQTQSFTRNCIKCVICGRFGPGKEESFGISEKRRTEPIMDHQRNWSRNGKTGDKWNWSKKKRKGKSIKRKGEPARKRGNDGK